MNESQLPDIITPKESISESYTIKQDNKIYKLNIKVIGQNIILNLLEKNDFFEEYEINLNLEEIKQLHKIFSFLKSTQEFFEFIQALIKSNKLLIKKEQNKISIEFIIEYLLKQNTIKIELNSKNVDLNIIVKDMFDELMTVNEKLKKIENDNNELKEENQNLKLNVIKIQNSLELIKNELNELQKDNEIKKDLNNNKEINILKNIEPHMGQINYLSILKDGRLISSSADGTIKIFSQNNFEVQLTINEHQKEINSFTLLNDDRIISCSDEQL